LRELGRTVSLLILMEQKSFARYDGPLAVIFGRDSHCNPYKANVDPESVFRDAYPAGFTVDIIAVRTASSLNHRTSRLSRRHCEDAWPTPFLAVESSWISRGCVIVWTAYER
jgi:hypothetical protein